MNKALSTILFIAAIITTAAYAADKPVDSNAQSVTSAAFTEEWTPTAKEFCVGWKVNVSKTVPFPCEAGVPAFLAAMRTLCDSCYTSLQDVSANTINPEEQPVTVDSLQRIMQNSTQFARLLAAKTLYQIILTDISKGKKDNEPLSDKAKTPLKFLAESAAELDKPK